MSSHESMHLCIKLTHPSFQSNLLEKSSSKKQTKYDNNNNNNNNMGVINRHSGLQQGNNTYYMYL